MHITLSLLYVCACVYVHICACVCVYFSSNLPALSLYMNVCDYRVEVSCSLLQSYTLPFTRVPSVSQLASTPEV